MKRLRVLSIVIIFILLGFSACVFAFRNPTPTPFLGENFIHTSVYGTLTALAGSTPTAGWTPTLPPLLPPNATPHDFIYYYFDNINIRNYTLTWSLLTDRFKANLNGTSQGGYTGYVDFWNSVQKVNVLNAFYVCDGDICGVNAGLTLQYIDGTVDTSAYDYTVIFDRRLNSWMFDFIPAPTATASRTLTSTRTYTRTTTPSPTRTGTATSTFTKTATPTSTRTFTATKTFTRTSTGTYTLTRTASLTATPTFSPSQTVTATPTFSPSQTVTATPTFPPTQTVTATASQTPTASSTPTFSSTSTDTYTASVTPTSTDTLTPSETLTPTSTETETPTSTPTDTTVP